MPEREIVNSASFFTDRLMWWCVMIVVTGTIARVFRSAEKVPWQIIVSEAVLAGVGAVGIYAYAEMKAFSVPEKVLCSVLMSLGGIHGIQRAIQVWQTLKGGK